MNTYEYKVVPAPSKGEKAKGVKTPEARFARALEAVINEMAGAGWEYMRAETLPHEERSGLTGSATTFRNVLIFRRETDAAAYWGQSVPGAGRQLTVQGATGEAEAPVPEDKADPKPALSATRGTGKDGSKDAVKKAAPAHREPPLSAAASAAGPGPVSVSGPDANVTEATDETTDETANRTGEADTQDLRKAE